ncbi:hypothetical protein TTHERM_000423269 (macronuclear) [Tetrahymena thermophila SB210]|uniref:Kazal-type proteinase inhibitor 1 n=1 Tax=Tetrahymena thermophila (strain SB210) TaxID=312017 RepID=W7XIV4_TETTS|nr:hypothetical protein TTHERM_000423269 [Tetrahymena thermophila SB210]EWS74951.1 hypothetical protein TTHERM_000423269 [Tetrahymena thermophila SB210]|eukprot:XP_012652492.1 hypothetical protein TTHERM_000423269 [Tetrahymena thermophila SB210]
MNKFIIAIFVILALAMAQDQCPPKANIRVMCPMLYNPVCATVKCATGICQFTFGNACNACITGAISFAKGPCPNDFDQN